MGELDRASLLRRLQMIEEDQRRVAEVIGSHASLIRNNKTDVNAILVSIKAIRDIHGESHDRYTALCARVDRLERRGFWRNVRRFFFGWN